MAAKPVVDGIERQHSGELIVLRLNVQDPASQPLMARFGFSVTPTFVFLNGAGQEVWRTMGAIDPQRVDQALAAP